MKSYPVRFNANAELNLDEISDFLLEKQVDVVTILGFIGRIRVQCERVGEVPYSGVAREDLGPGIRMRVFERSAVILYRVTGEAVEIVNIFYGGRDYEALFRD